MQNIGPIVAAYIWPACYNQREFPMLGNRNVAYTYVSDKGIKVYIK